MREHFPPHVCGGTDGKYGKAARHDSCRRQGPGGHGVCCGTHMGCCHGAWDSANVAPPKPFLISGLNRMGFGTGKGASPPEQEGEAGTRWGHEIRRHQPEAGSGSGWRDSPGLTLSPRQSLLGSLPLPSPPTPRTTRSQFGRATHIVLRPGLGISTGTPPPSLMTSRYCLPFPVPLTAGKHANPQLTALIITREFAGLGAATSPPRTAKSCQRHPQPQVNAQCCTQGLCAPAPL